MVQLTLGTKRTALALYGVLLVLPTLVLGGLHWRQLVIDHETMLAIVPSDAQDATRRLQTSIHDVLNDLVARESERPFYEYRDAYFPPGEMGGEPSLVASPLRSTSPPRGILGWFSYGTEDTNQKRAPKVMVGGRQTPAKEAEIRSAIHFAAQELQRQAAATWLLPNPFYRWFSPDENLSVPVLAINLADESNFACVKEEWPVLRNLAHERRQVKSSKFSLQFYREIDGTPRVVCWREVMIEGDKNLKKLGTVCLAPLGTDVYLRQGFLIDPNWLFRELPAREASRVLKVSQTFVPMDAVTVPGEENLESFRIQPVRVLGFMTKKPGDEEYGEFKVAVNVRELESRFRTQSVRFIGVAAMLVISLGTGMILLLRSVNRDLEAARRTENFVAAVTHELRTPVAAIKLYGEMLQDGWVDDPEKLKEYYRRIVRETARLETLVENVLEKSQLAQRGVAPEPGDLNDSVASLATSLLSLAPEGVQDLEFDYGEDLPLVMLIPEGVRSIVSNLVENARKYAPVAKEAASSEPIVVKTHQLAGNVVLDVMDRGPGIPHSERTKIFDAFYRVGNEKTRTARGTGLGLHLVALQSQAMGARVAVLDRKGGGSLFRITFDTAKVRGTVA
ncbi:MAG: HAMP domain-containing sensor histidine kinase [Planctomycetota bacterium]|nr:HAMP domain-containing sensor histidine kinase [Planctomycetota bacterium]